MELAHRMGLAHHVHEESPPRPPSRHPSLVRSQAHRLTNSRAEWCQSTGWSCQLRPHSGAHIATAARILHKMYIANSGLSYSMSVCTCTQYGARTLP